MSTKSKYAPDESLVGITPLQLDPKHAEEIMAIARGVPLFEPEQDKDLNGAHVPRFKALVELYHDDPSLLDKILVELIEVLVGHVQLPEDDEEIQELNHQSTVALVLLKIVSTVRGYKTVIKFLPHEVFLIPKLLQLLEHATAKDKYGELEYETNTMLLIWFLIVCRNPFDFNTFAGEDEVSYPVRITECLMTLRLQYNRFACLTLAETLTRHDDNSALLNPILDGCIERLLESKEPANLQKQNADLQLISTIFKKGKRVELNKYGEHVLDKLSEYLVLDVPNSDARLQTAKLVQRIALTYLKPKPASWRYKCGVRSLEENLKMAGIESCGNQVSEGTQQEAEEDIVDLDEKTKKLAEISLNCLLIGVRDKENRIRSSSAKGIGRIASRLPEAMADDVISRITEANFKRGASAGLWHGGAMAIAELSQRGCILPSRLATVMEIVSNALEFEDDARATAVNVRDAACYICWAFARGFEPKLMAPFMEKLACRLITTALFDRSVNVRRAASAAFQENVGRNKGFPHGIILNTMVDYQAVSRVDHCYESLCLEVAEFAEYVIPMVDSLSDVFVSHFQEKFRFLSAESLRHLAKFNPVHVVQNVIPKLVKNVNSPYMDTRQGSLLAIGSVIRGLHESKTYIVSDIKEIDELREMVPVLAKKYNSALTSGSSLMLRAVGHLIEQLSFTKMELADEELEEWHKIADRIAADLKEETREFGAKAVRGLMVYYHSDKRRNMFEKIVKNYLVKARSTDYEHSRIGAATGLGSIPTELLLTELDGKPLNAVIVDKLILVIEEELHSRWVNARTAAMDSMVDIVTRTESVNIEKDRILGCIFIAIRDNTRTVQGFVGQYVRRAAISALTNLLPVFEAKKVLSADQLGTAIYLIVEQCCERIDGLRECAAENLKSILEQHCLMGIPDREKLYSVFTADNVKWRVDGFTPLTPLLTSKYYRKPIILGLVNSIGGETSSWVQDLALGELHDYFRKNPQESDDFFQLIWDQLHTISNKNDALPPIRAFGRLFGEGCFYKVESNPDEHPLFVQIVKKMVELALSAPLPVRKATLEACQYVFQCDMKSSVFKTAMNLLTTLLNSKVAAIRHTAATQLQHGVIALDITNGVPIEALQPTLELLKERMWKDGSTDIENHKELSVIIKNQLTEVIQKYPQQA